MEHNEYWQERMLAIEEQSHDKGMKYAEHIDKQFRLAERNINRQIDYWYNKIAMNNEISLSAAKELLRKDELKDFHMSVEEYIEKGKQLDFDNSYMQELINASAKVHISRLEALKLQMQQECEVLYGNMADGLEDTLADIYTSSYYNTAYTFMKGTGVGWAFNKLDNRRIEKAINTAWSYDDKTFQARCWEHKKKLNNELNTILTQSIIRGESPQKAIEQLSKRMKVSRYNAGRLIMTESSAIYSASQKDAFKELDVERYEFVATLDSHTSETCRHMDGKIFDMKDYKVGVTAPPLHCFCYDKETEVYTSNGWKLFSELTENDLVYTLDKETLIPEWQKSINYISYKYKGNLIHFKNDRTDILVTPNHRMLVQNMDRTVKDKSWKLRRADNIGRKSKNRMYASCEWKGTKTNSVVLGGKKVDIETYLKFMAYWIADGSCTFYKGHYHVKIAQCDNQWMYEELKKLPFKIYKCKESIMIHDDALGKDLEQYGKCNEKYIPKLIKGLDKDSIQTFLIAYSKTDGTLRKGKNWKGYQFNDSIQFFTTSNKLAGDIGELIMKVGGRPSYYLNHTKGKEQEFENGVYTINHDVWTIRWNKQQYSWINNMNVVDVPYDDFVYCLEVEKHNTLLVRRNGKVLWSGNCRSVTVPYYEDDFGSVGERAARGEDGKTYHVPANITYREWEDTFLVDKDLATEMFDLKEHMLQLADKKYLNIWKDPVTVEQFRLKKSAIDAKRSYFNQKLATATEADKKKFEKLLADLDDFEEKGQEYEETRKKVQKISKDLKRKANSGRIEDDRYSQERKDEAMWTEKVKEADGMLRSKCGEVWQDAPKEERQAIYDYTTGSGSFNRPLAGFEKPYYEYGSGWEEKYNKGVGNVWIDYEGKGASIRHMTDLIDKSEYDFDMWLQRGCDNNAIESFLGLAQGTLSKMSEDDLQQFVGMSARMYNFISCGVAKGKGFDSKPIILNIYAPAGTKMMYAEPFSHFGNGSKLSWDGISPQSSYGGEAEMIIQRGASYTITKIEQSNGTIYIDLEVHPEDGYDLIQQTDDWTGSKKTYKD